MHETPALGVNFDLDSTFIGEPPGMLAHNAEPHLRWFRTVIELDTASTLRWWSLSTRNLFLYVRLLRLTRQSSHRPLYVFDRHHGHFVARRGLVAPKYLSQWVLRSGLIPFRRLNY